MVHDCMFTKNYFILLDLPVILDPEVINAGFSLPYKWHPEYGARVGLLPREGSAEDVRWHDIDPCFVFHPMNAYEDDQGRVVLDVDQALQDVCIGYDRSRPKAHRASTAG